MFLKLIFAKGVRVRAFSRHIFPAHCRFSYFVSLPFSFIFSAISRKWSPKLFVLDLRQIFTVIWPSSQRNFQSFNNTERRVNKAVKKKVLRRQTKEWRAVCFEELSRNSIEKAIYKYHN